MRLVTYLAFRRAFGVKAARFIGDIKGLRYHGILSYCSLRQILSGCRSCILIGRFIRRIIYISPSGESTIISMDLFTVCSLSYNVYSTHSIHVLLVLVYMQFSTHRIKTSSARIWSYGTVDIGRDSRIELDFESHLVEEVGRRSSMPSVATKLEPR